MVSGCFAINAPETLNEYALNRQLNWQPPVIIIFNKMPPNSDANVVLDKLENKLGLKMIDQSAIEVVKQLQKKIIRYFLCQVIIR